MLVSSLMKLRPFYVRSYDTCRAAARLMRNENIGFLPICDGQRRVLGVLTDRDIAVRVVADGLQTDAPVGDVMTREVVSCRHDEDLSRVEQVMAASHKSRIVVVDEDGRLEGVLSLSDLVEHDVRNAAALVARVSEREARQR